jgi:hypothetical protein
MVWKYSVGILVIIEGGATGADRFAKEWAEKHEAFGVRHEQYPAKWRENGYYNPTAGFERNKLMITDGKPDLGLWFPGGNGTKDMVSKLKAAGITVIRGENMHGIGDVVQETLGSA